MSSATSEKFRSKRITFIPWIVGKLQYKQETLEVVSIMRDGEEKITLSLAIIRHGLQAWKSNPASKDISSYITILNMLIRRAKPNVPDCNYAYIAYT